MFPSSRPRRIAAPLLGAVGLFAGLLVAAAFAAPRVREVTPTPGSRDVPASSRISLVFSRPMDRVSVESRLAIVPARPGRYTWEGTTLTFHPEAPWEPGTAVEVRLPAGARSSRFLPILQSHAWSFVIGAPRIAYLWPADGPSDIYARTPDGGEPTRLTTTPVGVLDFRLSPEGTQVIYAAAREDGGSDLRLLDLATQQDRLLYSAPVGSLCRAPAISPDGKWLAFERYDLESTSNERYLPGPGRVWVTPMDAASQAVPVGPDDHGASAPGWTPQGWLVYQDRSLGAIAVVDMGAAPDLQPFNAIPNELGDPGTWSIDGRDVVFSEVGFVPETVSVPGSSAEEQTIFYSHLIRVEASTGNAMDLSNRSGSLVEDASPVYSPDGNWLAFGRKYMDSDRWTLGRQLWLMRANGSEAHALTAVGDYNHSALGWSPDSTTLVYMRFNQAVITEPAEIWLIGADGEGAHPLVTGGYSPRWIP